MRPPFHPDEEVQRLKALRQFHLLDTLPEQVLDDLTTLVAHICGTPVSLISLIDEKRQWFKSKVGLDATELPRDISFCGHTILQRDLLVVPDAKQDERFADNPLVMGDPHIGFYAGAPLITADGYALGTLCVIDRVPRTLTPMQQEALRVLSRQVMAQLEIRRQAHELAESEERLFKVFRNGPVALAVHRGSDRTFVDVNAAFTALLGWTREEVVGRTAAELNIVEESAAAELHSHLEVHSTLRNAEMAVKTRSGEIRQIIISTERIELHGEPHAITTFIDVTERTRAEATLAGTSQTLAAVTEALAAYVERGDWKAAMGRLLRCALDQTQSEYGFIGVVVGSTLRVLAHEGIVWDKIINRDFYEQALRSYEKVGYLEFTSFNNLFGRAITTGQVVIANTPDSDPRSGGRPTGHPPMRSFLGVPIFVGEQVHGLVALANRPGGYSEDEQRRIETLVQHAGGLCTSYRQREAAVVLERERAQAEAARAQAEGNRRAVWRTSIDAIITMDESGNITDFNPAAEKTFGYRAADVIGHPLADKIIPPAMREGHRRGMARFLATGQGSIMGRRIELSALRSDGTEFPVELTVVSVAGADRPTFLGTVRDITERKQAEQRIQHLNRVYLVLSEINQTIVREKNVPAMLAAACRIAVEQGQFRFAWIGLANAPDLPIKIAAHAGADADTIELLKGLLDSNDPGRSCAFTLRALQTGQHGVCNDVARDPQAAHWRGAALERNYRALAALPLKVEGQIVGTFNLYAEEPDFFDADEIRLLDELATDISFALEVNEREQERRATEDRHFGQRNMVISLTSSEGFLGGHLAAALQQITEAAARTLGVSRVSVWRYNKERNAIGCVDLYEAEANRHSSGLELSAAQYPAYFRALAEVEVIAANDARRDPRTSEFANGYLDRLGITSMMDAPIHVRGVVDGVLCHEQVGPPRQWTTDEKTFALAMSNLVSLALEGSERKRVEQALRESEERFRQLAENIQEVFWMTDPAKNQMLYISPAYEKIWGRSCQSLYDSPRAWVDTIHPDDRERVLQATVTKQSCGEYDETFRIQRADGTTRWIHDRAFPVRGENGEVVRVVGTAEDITERRQLQEQFLQSQKMEAIGQLAGGVAHDFNNILTVIQGYGSLLLMSDQSLEERKDAVEQIVRASEQAANLTRQLLAFSRRQVMQPRQLDLNEIVTSLTKMLQRLVGEDVHLQLNLHPRALLTRADAGMLDQVLLNLVVNARDAMPGGGRLFIETNEKTFTAEEAAAATDTAPGRYVGLTVTDTGSGMTPEILARIFEPFFTTKEPGKGTGLGLATVFGIVKQHSGAVTVQSEVGKGTTFQIFLRAEQGAEKSRDVKGVKPKPRGGTETILLVEDDPGVRLLTRAVLERSGYQVLEAPNGVAAQKIWEQHQDRIQLLFTDIVMPEGVSGRDLAALLQARNPRLRVIFTSGYSADIAGRELTLQEGQNFIQKPSSPLQLLETVRRTLDD